MTHWEWRELKTSLQLSAFPLHLYLGVSTGSVDSATVSILDDDSIVEVNETFSAVLSVPVAESALGVSVSATNGTAYVEIQDNGKQSPLHMHVIVC